MSDSSQNIIMIGLALWVVFTAELVWSMPTPFSEGRVQAAAILSSEVPAIEQFREIAPGMYRGARPSDEGLAQLAQRGFRAILSIEDDTAGIAAEQPYVESLGMRFISKPVPPFVKPTDEHIDSILAALIDPANQPVFIHCTRGKDRTGLIVGLYRVLFQGWEPKAAYEEMLKYQFHPELNELREYFEERTGWKPSAVPMGSEE